MRNRIGCVLLFALTTALPAADDSSPPVDARFFQSPSQQQTYLKSLKAMLDQGLEQGQSLPAVRRQLAMTRRVSGNDPRLDYAYGLVLLKQFEYDEAEKQFQSATTAERPAYLPAWQALIRLHLQQQDREQFLTQTTRLAKLAGSANAQWIGEDQPQAAAQWLGSVFEYLALPGVDWLTAAQLAEHQQRLKAELPPAFAGDWEHGRQKLKRAVDQLKVEIEQKQQDVKTQLKDSADRKTTRLDERKQELEQKQESVQRSAKEWKAWVDQQLQQSKTELDVLQRDYQTLDAAGKRLNGVILQTQIEIGQLQTRMQLEQNQRTTRTRVQRPSQLEVLLGRRQQELLRYQMQYGLLEQRAGGTIKQAQKTLAARQAAVRQYQQATGANVRRDQALDRWKTAVEKSALKTAAKAQDADPLDALEKRLSQVTSYFPLDPKTEAARLLQSYVSP